MRLDARDGDGGYWVFHVPTCKPIRDVLWVDDVSLEYFVVHGYMVMSNVYYGENHKAEKSIVIDKRRKIVLIDPVDDDPKPTDFALFPIPTLTGVL